MKIRKPYAVQTLRWEPVLGNACLCGYDEEHVREFIKSVGELEGRQIDILDVYPLEESPAEIDVWSDEQGTMQVVPDMDGEVN